MDRNFVASEHFKTGNFQHARDLKLKAVRDAIWELAFGVTRQMDFSAGRDLRALKELFRLFDQSGIIDTLCLSPPAPDPCLPGCGVRLCSH
jgi:hypothetical protein